MFQGEEEKEAEIKRNLFLQSIFCILWALSSFFFCYKPVFPYNTTTLD